MNPDLFNDVSLNSSTIIKDYVKNTTSVANMLYQLEGGDDLIQTKDNQTRLMHIDRYYIAKYRAETRILQSFIFFCCLVLIGCVLLNNGLFTTLMFTCYVSFIFLLMIYVIGLDMYNIFIRDNTNFDEIDYYPPSKSDSMYKTHNTVEISNLPSCPS
jgi:hypothetical protein